MLNKNTNYEYTPLYHLTPEYDIVEIELVDHNKVSQYLATRGFSSSPEEKYPIEVKKLVMINGTKTRLKPVIETTLDRVYTSIKSAQMARTHIRKRKSELYDKRRNKSMANARKGLVSIIENPDLFSSDNIKRAEELFTSISEFR